MEANPKIASSLNERIEEVNKVLTPEFFESLMRYGIIRLNRRFNIKYNVNRGFRGVMIEDIITETLESFTRQGGRVWNKADFPDFKKQVFSAFDSCLYNYVRKELTKLKGVVELPLDQEFEDKEVNYEEMIKSAKEILESLNATEMEKEIFEPYYIHNMKREDVAEYLGVDVTEITNAGKRLDRKLPVLRDRLKGIYYGG